MSPLSGSIRGIKEPLITLAFWLSPRNNGVLPQIFLPVRWSWIRVMRKSIIFSRKLCLGPATSRVHATRSPRLSSSSRINPNSPLLGTRFWA